MVTDEVLLPEGFELREPFLPAEEADALMVRIRQETDWRQDTLRIFGRQHLIPRLHQWYADPGVRYAWSGIQMTGQGWPEMLAVLRERISAACGHRFNSVLLNLYRDGADSMGWHADDEPELGHEPVIASLSLGACRDFRIRHKTNIKNAYNIPLAHGSLLLMQGCSQHEWQHCLPKRKRVSDPRINLTFRKTGQAG